MGALPKRRISTGRKGRRRSAIKLKLPALVPCPDCGQPKRPHVVCPNCGAYKGKEIAKQKTKKDKKPAKGGSASGRK